MVSQFLKKIIYSSFFLAGIPAILIIIFIYPIVTKSRLEVESVNKGNSMNVYEDLNSDSVSEVVSRGKGMPYYFVIIKDNDMKVYDQWNLKDTIDPDMSDFFFGDYDHDLYKEIYIFTYKGDSLFLNINEFFDSGGTKSDHIYITGLKPVNHQITSMIWPAGFYDTNGDGRDELYFSIQTGFGLVPRRLYSYDIVNKELRSSQYAGVICQFPKMMDADGDGRPEIFGLIGASGNFNTWVPFSDWSTWFMVFNDSLKLKFLPAEFPGLTNHLNVNAYSTGGFKGYAVTHYTGSADTTVLRPRIMLYSPEGQMIRERTYSDLGLNIFTYLAVIKDKNTDRLYLLANELLELNDQLEVVNKVKPSLASYYKYYSYDVNFDGESELILYSADEEKLVIYSPDLRKLAEARLKGKEGGFRFSLYKSKEQGNKIFMSAGGDNGYFLNLKRNSYYYLGYLAYPGIYMLIFGFIVLIKKINTLQVVQKESLKRRLVTLQLQSIKSQLDPHFTFNTLNSIASLIYLEDRELAYDYMIKFTELLRGLINDAERIYRSLAEELDFVTAYLDLEKLRFGEKFNYNIIIGEGVTKQEQVPKLVLHTFAENAIKHGIMASRDGGALLIKVEKRKDYLILTIEDNGIGRVKAESQTKTSGKGLKLTGEFYDILNQINKKAIKHSIIDLHNDSGESIGTRVEVSVPLN